MLDLIEWLSTEVVRGEIGLFIVLNVPSPYLLKGCRPVNCLVGQ